AGGTSHRLEQLTTEFTKPRRACRAASRTIVSAARPIPERSRARALSLRHQPWSKPNDKISDARPRGRPCVCAGNACDGAAGDLQPRLLRAVLSKRQLPEPRAGKSLYRRLPAADLRRAGLSESDLSKSGLSGSRLARQL